MINVLKVGRQMGYDNIVQIQNLRRAYKSPEAGKFTANLVLPSNTYTYTSQIIPNSICDNPKFQDIILKFFPKSYSEKAKNFVTIVLNKFSKDAGTLSIETVTKNGDEIVSNASIKAAKNAEGVIIKAASSGEAGMRSALEATISKYGLKNMDYNDLKFQYKEAGSMGKADANLKAKEGFSSVKMSSEAPLQFLDKITEIATFGRFKTIKELSEGYNKVISLLKDAEI